MNYKKFSPVICLILILVINSCNDNSVESLPDGAYNYTAYDSLGTIISKGWLMFEVKDSSNINGNWEINKVGNPQNIGPQIGKGKLEGSFNDSVLVLGLNPDFVDNNVVLSGELKLNKYEGKWYYSSFIGLTNWGSFKADKE